MTLLSSTWRSRLQPLKGSSKYPKRNSRQDLPRMIFCEDFFHLKMPQVNCSKRWSSPPDQEDKPVFLHEFLMSAPRGPQICSVAVYWTTNLRYIAVVVETIDSGHKNVSPWQNIYKLGRPPYHHVFLTCPRTRALRWIKKIRRRSEPQPENQACS